MPLRGRKGMCATTALVRSDEWFSPPYKGEIVKDMYGV